MTKRSTFLFLLFTVLCASASASAPQWLEVRSPHFTVLTDSNEQQGRAVADQFERMRWMFQTLYPKRNVDPVAPIVVIAAKNQKSFQALEPEAYLAKGQVKLGGLFMRSLDKNYVLLRLDAVEEHPFANVYHEYTHLQFSADSALLPLWLNEGLAEFMQNTEIRSKDVWLGEPSTDNILFLRQNQLIPLDVLFRIDAKSPYYHEEQKGSIFYAESWALTHYLILSDSVHHTHKSDDYYALVLHHTDPVEAAQKAFGDLNQLQKKLDEYIRHGEYRHLVLSSAAAPLDESAYSVRILKQTEADAACADFMAYVLRLQDARSLIDTVFKADPYNAQAHETMGYIAARDGKFDAAQKWYEEATQLGSRNFLAYYYSANYAMSQGIYQHQKEIEANLRTAIRLNPRYAPAYEQLASALMTLDRISDAEAVLNDLLKVSDSATVAADARQRLTQIKHLQSIAKSRATMETVQGVVGIDDGPKHPNEAPTGPKHEAIGVIRGVSCSYPSVIEFRVENARKSVSLYNNNYSNLNLSVLDFTPPASLNPCTGLEGMKARVQFAESSDKSVDGQAISIELRK